MTALHDDGKVYTAPAPCDTRRVRSREPHLVQWLRGEKITVLHVLQV